MARFKLNCLFVVVGAFVLGASGAILQKYFGFGDLFPIANKSDRFASPTLGIPTRTAEGINDAIREEFQGRLSLFILAGQSNMSGRGELPSAQAVNPRIFMFGNNYRWKVATEPIDAPDGQVDAVSQDDAAGVGPGMAFATALSAHYPDMVIGLIPCAKGATSIEEWQRKLGENTLYGSCLKRVRAATTMGSVAGMLFFQGEADALDPLRYPDRPRSASIYAPKFSAFVDHFREDVSLPSLPVVFAQIGTNKAPTTYAYWHSVQEQQRKVDLPCVAMITTADLPLRDEVHFTTQSYQIIGQRYADAFLKLRGQTPYCR